MMEEPPHEWNSSDCPLYDPDECPEDCADCPFIDERAEVAYILAEG